MGLTCLIKLVELELIYRVLYSYFDTTRTRHVNRNCHPKNTTHTHSHTKSAFESV